MAIQHPLTLVTPVLKEKYAEMYGILRALREDLEADKHSKFKSFDNIHYARWVIIDDEGMYGNPENQGMKLVLEVNYDGTEDNLLTGLSNEVGAYIDHIYQNCEDYMPESERSPENRVKYLKKWRQEAAAFYKGSPGVSLIQIRQESTLRNYIRNLIDSNNWSKKSATEVHKLIKEDVFSKPEFDWAKNKIKLPRIKWLGMIMLACIIIPLVPLVIIWVLIIEFFYERKDSHFSLTRSQLEINHIKRLEEYEDLPHQPQNQFTQLCVMKPGIMRLLTFKGLMLFAKGLIAFYFVKGKLMGIPTIHFARWVLFDNNKRVLFFSNFDGSWQQYLGDFIDQSGWGLTGIFSNTTNFPKTRFLFTGGAYDEEHFLAWSRYTELQTQVWYCAYPDLSIKNINNNTIIRAYLTKNVNEENSTEFLKHI